eukprot:892286-Pyramimonas_sp.AAC.1
MGVPKREQCHASDANEALGGALHKATKRVRGVPKRTRWCHASAAVGTFGGVPYGATKRVR